METAERERFALTIGFVFNFMSQSHSAEHIRKIVETRRKNGSYIPWNKGKRGLQNAWNKGLVGVIKMSDKTRERMRLSARKGADSIHWKGDNVGYWGLHVWVIANFGQPDTCLHCGKNRLFGHKIHWANVSGKYKRDENDWIRLCVKCHSKFDREKI